VDLPQLVHPAVGTEWYLPFGCFTSSCPEHWCADISPFCSQFFGFMPLGGRTAQDDSVE